MDTSKTRPDPSDQQAAETDLYRARATERLRAALDQTPAQLTEWERELLAAKIPDTPQRYTTADENAAAEDIRDTEARQAAELVTEAEATDGTWRGNWIGDHPTT
ncbi:hypothetical protein [Streptomyces sp. NPDC088707]|uniref:hypothetical protein n=1 Tax=Streptomyces sp. NPDC088707 TaxID=3365871 RepID=UPI0037F6C698